MEAYIYEQTGDLANAKSVLWPLRELKFTQEQMEEEAWYLAMAVKASVATPGQEMTADPDRKSLPDESGQLFDPAGADGYFRGIPACTGQTDVYARRTV